MFENILIPTDGSDPAREAAERGIELASGHGATVHVLHAVEPIPLGGISSGPSPASAEFGEVVEEQRAKGQEDIDDIVALAEDAAVEAAGTLEHGKPDEAIIEYANNEAIDVIVMGTHGRSGADRLLIGSVAEKVVRRSPVPVLTVRGTA